MPVVTIKAPRGARKDPAALLARVRAQADTLLCDASRVLVVYGAEAASIYYDEGDADGAEPPSRPLPRAS